MCITQIEVNENYKIEKNFFLKENNLMIDSSSNQIYENKDLLNSNQTELNSILNYCEEQIKESDEYKKAALRRARSVQVPKKNESKQDDDDEGKKAEKKVVRFADMLGLDLVKIKVIQNPDRPPRVPKHILQLFRESMKYSDDDDDDDEDDDEEYYNDNEWVDNKINSINGKSCKSIKNSYLNSIISNKSNTKPIMNGRTVNGVSTTLTTTASQLSSQKILTDDDSFLIKNCKCELKWKQCFEQPGLKPDFFLKLNEKKALLETIHLKSQIISGIVRVLNICFNKNVKIRYTIDNWKTFNDIETAYINNSCDGLTDRFSFNLNLEAKLAEFFNNSQNFYNRFKIQFAIVFETKPTLTENNEYWDNNYGLNYLIECINNTTPVSKLKNNDILCDLSNSLSAAFV